ncbi:hypothetical protein [Nonomuraea rubra]|uniref:Uncharacterized protein n=1 Tax=Nonomuraea rubra TaxID=46180 RepID=A0A7X0TVX1_9ACTN|nr:hypothetical protein [Nonomuraea rubra]MBB6545728.1 hypothetical protein [Nonomuraea rubra]
MPRHRPGRIAVTVLAILVVASGVVALTTGDARLSVLLVHARFYERPHEVDADVLAMLVLVGLVHVWGLWQVLPKRHDGGRPGRDERLLRMALYAWLVLEFADRLPFGSDVLLDLAQAAATVLFFRVMRTVHLALRLVALVVGLLAPVRSLAVVALALAGVDGRALYDVLPVGGVPWVLWLVLTLVAQAKDGRWRRGTLWVGAVVAARPELEPMVSFPFGRYYVWFEGASVAFDVLLLVWLGRSAREAAGEPKPPPGAVPRRALRWWPAQGAAVVVPLVPAVVNCVNGVFAWVGPHGAVASWFYGNGWFLRQLWLPLDLLIGIGGASGLVLAAVLLRTRRLVLGTIAALLLAAAAGAVSGMTTWNEGTRAVQAFESALHDTVFGSAPKLFDELRPAGPGLSPLWFSAAFTVSALLLFLAYVTPPARRNPYRVAAASLATGVLLALVPASDQEPDRTSTSSECEAEFNRRSTVAMTGEREFVCGVRYSTAPLFGEDMPDRRVIAYGHRMCGVYTRGDARESARFRQAYGVDPLEQTGLLASICPKAEAELERAAAEEEAEMLAWEAEERAMCDRAPRHRPLIEPVRATRKTVWPEIGLEAFEDADVPESGLYEQDVDLVAAAPGHLVIVLDNTENRLCVTTETYGRRPPVETKGWQHVVEVGYESPTGTIELADNLAGIVLPDLSLRGRKGHYRIRVHYDPPDWERKVGQRLLVMAWPGRGEDRVVHRAPQG